ncbi:30S ribosomal protein S18 [Geodermatophilus sp. SYSU D01106]
MSPQRRTRSRRPRRIDGPVSYRDVELLRTFLSDRGKIRARRVTGLSAQQQRRVARAVATAREMALLPYPSSGRSRVAEGGDP